MKIVQINSQEIKISYSPVQEKVFMGDILKITDDRASLVAQIHEITSQAENISLNTASLKILFSLQQNKWVNWAGEIPSVNAVVEKVTKEEILEQFNVLNAENPVNIGQYSGVKFAPGISDFKNSCVIFSDKQEEKQDLVSLIASELLNYEQKIAILDFTGEYLDVETTKIKAGVDFKLPLNAKGMDKIYSNKFEGASAESQAVIEDVFIEVREYAKTCEEGFIPFSSFKEVVDNTYEQSGITQLVLLKNRLLKYEQSGIFADNEQEIDALKIAFEKDNLIVVDLSEIPEEWQKDFVDNIVSSNIEKNHQNFYLVLDINKNNFDTQLINKLFVKGVKSGIIPILTTCYTSLFIENLLNYAKNLFLFKPSLNLPDNFAGIFNYVSKLNNKEYIICGELTKYVPVFVGFSQEIVEESPVKPQEQKEYIFYSPMPEEEEKEEESPATLIAEEEPEQVVLEETPSGEDYDEEFLDIAQEISENEGEYIEFEEEEEISFENEEKTPTVHNEIKNEIAKDVDEFYIKPKEEEEQISPSRRKIPVYSADYSNERKEFVFDIKEGDTVRHQKYGTGVVKKIISYGNKKLCSIHFDNVGRRLLDPELAVIEKI